MRRSSFRGFLQIAAESGGRGREQLALEIGGTARIESRAPLQAPLPAITCHCVIEGISWPVTKENCVST